MDRGHVGMGAWKEQRRGVRVSERETGREREKEREREKKESERAREKWTENERDSV